jgi:hypothetical protein
VPDVEAVDIAHHGLPGNFTVNIQVHLSGLSQLAARFIIMNTQLLPK